MGSQTIVIKLGGSSLQNNSVVENLALLIQNYRSQGKSLVVVHGGGPAINAALTARGITWNFIGGQRVTTPEMVETIETVLKKNINGMIVDILEKQDVPALGVSGNCNNLLLCEPANPELQRVGRVIDVNTSVIHHILQQAVPVIAPLGVDKDGLTYNINADWAAAKIAIALQASEIIYLTDQKGIWDENKQVLSQVNQFGLQKLVDTGVVVGGMLAKTQTILAALTSGVSIVRILHAEDVHQFLKGSTFGTTCSLKNISEGIADATV